ncbi:hypothetical protein [Mameliella sediminis]|uniref:hypothetical protein n=1 Tax=Mameliella sediminis TaxID=2836866 RepID=UPI001C4568DE|nr:hypothetical protein [Mameliella sediminis]MBV7394670.1 hypothetical protein [Mameliella sediminis]MBY6163119.1 hypothetical protein [Mameliella alba]MBY6171383.1 hypothetical protein [Mameliella alba]MBY6176607.1 hypothetical protein [Mameliella alba]
MQGQGLDLSGDWTGVYDYGHEGAEAVPFTASLFDVCGVVWGTTLEPNSFAPEAGAELEAEISGSRSAREVHFRKAYFARPRGGEDPVHYSGHVSADGNRIEGRWTIRGPGYAISGPFVMNRIKGAAARASRRAKVSVEIDLF